MNSWNEDLDNDDNPSGGDLRALLEKSLKDNKALKTQLATAERTIAVSTVSTSLKDKGYKESAAKFAALDGVDLKNEDALTKWLESEGKDFRLPDSEQTPNETPGEPEPQSEAHEELARFNNNADRLRSSASPADQNRYVAALKSLPDDATPAQVDAAFKGL